MEQADEEGQVSLNSVRWGMHVQNISGRQGTVRMGNVEGKQWVGQPPIGFMSGGAFWLDWDMHEHGQMNLDRYYACFA